MIQIHREMSKVILPIMLLRIGVSLPQDFFLRRHLCVLYVRLHLEINVVRPLALQKAKLVLRSLFLKDSTVDLMLA